MDLELRNKVVVVTGASHGLGKAVGLAVAAEGAAVGVNYHRNPEKAQAVAREIASRHAVEAVAIRADVSNPAEVAAMFDEVEARLGPVDILVNNAAVCPTGPVREMTADEWTRTLEVNLSGTFLCCREMVRRRLAADRPGRIVNVASVAAFRGSTTGHAPYDASKGGMIAFTVSLAREVAPRGIAVNAVAPGMMFTEMTSKTLTANMPKYLARIPLGRIGQTEEVADVIVFLASKRAAYMTGATVDVSGGMLMR